MGFPLVEQAREQKKQEREKIRKKTVDKTISLLKTLREEIPFEQAYLFGSVARPYHFKKDSDVDIAFEGLDERDTEKLTAKLSLNLERPVNVVHLQEVHFSDKIQREGIQWKNQ